MPTHLISSTHLESDMERLLQCSVKVNAQRPLFWCQRSSTLFGVVCIAGRQLGNDHHNSAESVQTGGDEQNPTDHHNSLFVEDEQNDYGHWAEHHLKYEENKHFIYLSNLHDYHQISDWMCPRLLIDKREDNIGKCGAEIRNDFVYSADSENIPNIYWYKQNIINFNKPKPKIVSSNFTYRPIKSCT